MSTRRAFTLIELLVVVAIIAMLVSILLPSLSGARDHAKRVKCQSNLRNIGNAVHYYFDEYLDAFPWAKFYGCLGYEGRSQAQAMLGSQDPVDARPMNRYFSVTYSTLKAKPQVERQHNDVFRCPSDAGDPWVYPYFGPVYGPFFIEHGSSYTYASDSREIDQPDQPPMVPTFGVQSCRDLRLATVRFPAKKIVFQEPTFTPAWNHDDDRAQWHEAGQPHGNLLFADGHVEYRHPTPELYDPFADPNEHLPYY